MVSPRVPLTKQQASPAHGPLHLETKLLVRELEMTCQASPF